MTEFRFRKGLVDTLGNEIGKSVYKQFTQNEKYIQHNLSYLELKQLIDTMYSTIYELMYKDHYGEPIATGLMEHKVSLEKIDEKVDADVTKT